MYSVKVVIFGKRTVVLGQKRLYSANLSYSGKSGCIRVSGCFRAVMVVIMQSGCIRAKVIVFGQSGCIRTYWWYSGKSCGIIAKIGFRRAKMGLFVQSGCNLEKVVEFVQM